MPTYIHLVEGDSITVRQSYRDVYEKLLGAGWSEPCEFTQHRPDADRPLTINPTYVVYFREA